MKPRPASSQPAHLQQEIRYVETLLMTGHVCVQGQLRAGLGKKAAVQRMLRRLIRRLREQMPQD